MKTRIMTAIVALIVFLPFLIFSENTYVFLIFGVLISMMGTFEMLSCLGLRKRLAVALPSYLYAVSVSLLTRVGNFEDERFMMYVGISTFFYLIVIFTVTIFSKGALIINDTVLLVAMVAYLTVGFASIIRIRDMDAGQYTFLLAFGAPWITDIFAYFIGCRFGKHKLIPDVSPKKSVEGAVAGVVFCVLFFLGYGFVIQYFFDVNANYMALAVLGLISSVISQCGDLLASLIKRHYGIKDYGKVLPGHGGILDRFDSVIAVSSVMYMALMMASALEMFTVLG